MIPDWLKAICPEEREDVGRPFALDVNGERWLCATNGHMAAAIRSDADAPECARDVIASALRNYMQSDTPHLTSMAELQRTRPAILGPKECGKCEGGKIVCDECRGLGYVLGDAPCHDCGSTRDECDECDGEGKTDCDCSGINVTRNPHLVAVNNVVINARFLWLALPHVEGNVVRVGIGSDLDPVVVAGEGWRIIVMPVRGALGEAVVSLRLESEVQS